MSLLVYSIGSHRRIAHFPHCKIINRIAKENRRTFASLEEAQENGYRLCNCCPSVAQKYRKERKAVDAFCRENGLEISLKNGALHIRSRHDRWQIISNGQYNKLCLYHKNKGPRRPEKIPSTIPGFHSQAYRAESILDYLRSIRRHDNYRDIHPCTEWEEPETIQYKPSPLKQMLMEKGLISAEQSAPGPPIKGSKRYRKEQKIKKEEKRRVQLDRVFALIDKISATNSQHI